MAGSKVLVVEDEALVCELVTEALADEGIAVLCAASYSEAVEHLHAHAAEIRVLFTDIDLGPPPDGFAVAVAARRANPDVFVLYTSGRAEADVVTHGVAGALVVPKPYNVVQVASRIASLARFAGTRDRPSP